MWLYPGQIVIPDFGFYGRDMHLSLLREERLIVGVRRLDELKRKAPEMRDAVMQIKEKVGRGVIHDDAVELAKYAPSPIRVPDTMEWHGFIAGVMEQNKAAPVKERLQSLRCVYQELGGSPGTASITRTQLTGSAGDQRRR
jgi:hypothetical protein